MLNIVTIDLEWTAQEIDANLNLLEQLNARAEHCPHRWTVPLLTGDYCIDCQVVLPDELQESARDA